MNRAATDRALRVLEALGSRLEAAFEGIVCRDVAIAWRLNGREGTASVRERAEPAKGAYPVGCVTKLLVAVLVAEARHRFPRGFDAPVARLLGANSGPVLRGVTVRQLLEHTHGFDDAGLFKVPRKSDGRLDLEPLLDLLRPRRLAPPGRLYSYSSVGAWLLAALLERYEAEPFASLLERRFRALGLWKGGQPDAHSVCPATGGSLALSPRALCEFIAHEAAREVCRRPRHDRDAARQVVPLPGWNVLERGVRLGWKYYGAGWYGHYSNRPEGSLIVRVRAEDGLTVVLASRHHPAPIVAAQVLADLLPEFRRITLPRRLAPDAVARINTRAFCGHYASAAEVFLVEGHKAGLRIESGPYRARLHPATGGGFLAEPADPHGRFHFEFIEREGEAFRYLWDGRRVFRRIPNRKSPS